MKKELGRDFSEAKIERLEGWTKRNLRPILALAFALGMLVAQAAYWSAAFQYVRWDEEGGPLLLYGTRLFPWPVDIEHHPAGTMINVDDEVPELYIIWLMGSGLYLVVAGAFVGAFAVLGWLTGRLVVNRDRQGGSAASV